VTRDARKAVCVTTPDTDDVTQPKTGSVCL